VEEVAEAAQLGRLNAEIVQAPKPRLCEDGVFAVERRALAAGVHPK